MATERDIIAAWQWAAAELGIEITSPFVVGDEEFPVHVPLFARPAGALPIWIGDQRARREAEATGYFISLLNPEVYCKHHRALFVETLVDWGWFGSPNDAPEWYKEAVAKMMG
ncbi:MAG: hypothetical protein WEB58_14915 [Planctomycetaceae bacterium]